MYTRNNLNDINHERARVIDSAIGELMNHVVRGTPYTARELSEMTGRVISTSTFENCLSRGYRTLRKRRIERNVPEDKNTYSLFGSWSAECHIRKEGTRLITIKEYDEDKNLINERKVRRGRPYYTATF